MQTFLKWVWKGFWSSYSTFLYQPEIRPISNITGPSSMFLHLPILGSWRLERHSYRRYFKLIAAIYCTFLIAALIRVKDNKHFCRLIELKFTGMLPTCYLEYILSNFFRILIGFGNSNFVRFWLIGSFENERRTFWTLLDCTKMDSNIKRQERGSKKTGKGLEQVAAKKVSHKGVRITDMW